MKKKLILFTLLISIFTIDPYIVDASTNTFERTDSNLRIPDKVKYNSDMYNNIISTPSVDASEKVYDFADLFSEEEELNIYNEVLTFIDATELDLAIVTINYNPKTSTLVYADDFYDYNDFNINGIVYVIDMDNREFYISTSGTAILYYDDYRIESTLTGMDNSMYNGNYKESIDIMINKLSSYQQSGYSSNTETYTLDNGKVVQKTPYLTLLIISLIVAIIITIILIKRNKPVKLAKESSRYLAKNGIKITNSQRNFINSHTTSHYSPRTESSGGHSSSGGGIHSGSSGISHGGGGHKF